MSKSKKIKIIITIVCISFIQGLQFCVSPVLGQIQEHYPDVLKDRYKIDESSEENLLIQVAKVRGCLAKGGEPDYSRAAALVIDDYRSGKLGRITLEFPPVKKNNGDKVDSVQESGAADQGSESGEA